MNLLQRLISPIAKAVNREVGIRGAEPRKGNFQWMAGLPSKKVLKPITINNYTLKSLSNTDPITWAIKTARKAQVTQTEWDIVIDTESVENEIDRWFEVIMNNMNPWGYQEVFHPLLLNRDIYLRASADIKKILEETSVNDVTGAVTQIPKEEKKKQLKWYIESLKRKIKQDAETHAHIVKRIFEKPNDSESKTFRSFIEILLDDLLTFDAACIVKNKNAMGELAEMYLVPGQDVKIYRNPDRTTPKAPEPAYVWEDNGVIRAEYTKDEVVYMMANPQQNGYGFSPLEVAAYIITASLYADEYNIDFFKHSNVPPAVFNMGKNITEEQKTNFEAQWDNEVQGKGGLHKMMFIAGADSPQYIPMRSATSKEMQMMEYLKWTLSIKCACYQISPQDISFVQDFHRTTAQVQKEITKERGIKSLLSLIENYFNTEIVKKEFPFSDVKFEWLGLDINDAQVQANIDTADINNGVISRNDRRIKLGLKPIEGGDTILVNVGNQFIPIEELVAKDEDPEAEQPMEQAMDEKELQGEETNLAQEDSDAMDSTIENTTEPDSADTPLTDKQKANIFRMVVNATQEDKIAKAMGILKEQGLGENEVKITLEN